MCAMCGAYGVHNYWLSNAVCLFVYIVQSKVGQGTCVDCREGMESGPG